MNESVKRRAYTMTEFATMFGRKRAWAYKQKSLGKIRVIEGYGEMMVPASEIDRILAEKS